MKTTTFLLLALLGVSCSKDALDMAPDASTSMSDDPAAKVPIDLNAQPKSLTPLAADEPVPTTSGPLPADAHSLPNPERDGGSGTSPIKLDARHVSNQDTLGPEGCPAEQTWFFLEENYSVWCGTIGEACKAVCGTTTGCVVDVIGKQQMVHCPTKK